MPKYYFPKLDAEAALAAARALLSSGDDYFFDRNSGLFVGRSPDNKYIRVSQQHCRGDQEFVEYGHASVVYRIGTDGNLKQVVTFEGRS